MEKLEVSYATWKLIAQATGYSIYHLVVGANRVTCFAGSRMMVYVAEVYEGDYADWNSAFGSVSNEVAVYEDGLARTFGLNIIAAPITRDGRQIMLSSAIGDAQEVQFAGSGDDITEGIRLGGPHHEKAITTAGAHEETWQYMEWVSVAGGRVKYYDAVRGDCFGYKIHAPATVGDSNPGAGVYDKYNLGGEFNMYTPNPTMEGDWDLDLSENLNANVNITKVVPVIAKAKDGFFDWNMETGEVTLNLSGTGGYYLFDFAIPLTHIISHHHIVGDGESSFIVPASFGAKLLLPHYIHTIMIDKFDSVQELYLGWEIFLGRETTTP